MLNDQTAGFITYFMRAYPRRTALLITLLVLSGLAEGIGIATLLPLLELSVPQASHEPSAMTAAVAESLGLIGLSPRLEVLLSLIVLGMLLKGAFRLLAMKQVGYTVSRVSSDLRLRLIRALLGTRWLYFTSQSAGGLASSIGTEASRAASGYQNVCNLFASVTQAIIYGGVAFLVSWQMAIFAVFAGGVVVVVLGRLVESTRVAGQSQTRLMSSLLSRLTDAVQGIKPIKAMAREGHLQPLLEKETHELNRTQERLVLAAEAMKSAQEPLLVILMAIALYAALSIGSESMATVLVMAFLFYRLAGRIALAQNDYQSIAMGESAFWSMRERIDAALGQAEMLTGASPAPLLEKGIELDSVRFGYGEQLVLDGASLTIPAGEVVSIVGPSGAGKTTIADLIVGLNRPREGRVLVDGRPLEELDLRSWRGMIGYVPQEMFLFHDTVANNVALSDPAISRDGVREALVAAGAWGFVDELPAGLDTVLGERGSKISGGQRQRIAIARALVHRPRLLVLDEVTTALDPVTEAAICQTLLALRGEVTILAISHQPAMTEIADRVYRLEGGRLHEVEAPTARTATMQG
jgi:ATP-binding cassette subfamily C protein